MVDVQVLKRLLLVFILGGIVLSTWAAIETVFPAAQGSCSVNSYVSCGKIDSSGLTNTGPFPDWLIGLGGFLVMLAVYILYLRSTQNKDEKLYLKALTLLSFGGVCFLIYFAYVEVVIIGGICPVCTGAYLADVGALGASISLLRTQGLDVTDEETSDKAESRPAKRKNTHGRK